MTLAPSAFRPAWWLPHAHLQTLWAALARRAPRPALRAEQLELPDGDFLDLLWTAGSGGPRVLVLHGLEGGIGSPYAAGVLAAIAARGWRGVLMHFRGCSGRHNRLDRSYHSGDTGDLAVVLDTLTAREPDGPLAAVGYSLGGNVLLKYLAERGAEAPLRAAVAVSVPFDLGRSADTLARGLARLYQRALIGSLRRKLAAKFAARPCPVDLSALEELREFRSFDHHVTAPLHGFASAEDYYRRSSSRPCLREILTPTLVLHARDDPFMTPECVPGAGELGPGVRLELSEHGGHVGFVAGPTPWHTRYWLEERIPAFLAPHLER